jgi:outer membrane protein insertion porin family
LNGNRIIDVDVHVDVRKPRSVSISGGFSPSEGIRGTIGLAHNNLYKRNLRAGGKLRIGTRGNLYELTLIEPWFIGRTIGTFRLFEDNLEEHDDTRARGVTTSLAKRLGAFSNFGVQYKYQELRQRLDESTEEFTTVSSVGVSFHRDNRDSFLDPKQGWLNEFGAEYAGGFIRGRTSFFKFTADNRVYQPIPKLLFARNMVFASSLRLGFAQGLRSNRERSIASFERFWAGGSTTVRGYKERSLGPVDAFRNRRGNVMFIFNTELRFPIYNIVGGVVFFDAGNVWDKPAEITKVAPLLESAVGVGVRVFTPLGPARIDYGFPLVKGRSPEFYVELGHAF